jgi:general secretion pathway protein J
MRQTRGFTLIEVLVAVAIVAIIGVIGLTGLSRVIDQQEVATVQTERWRKIQLAMRMIVQDLSEAHPRLTHDEYGTSTVGCFVADATRQFALEFSRGGWANPAGLPRGTVLRVAYNWEDDKLVRWHWAVMDRTLSTPPVRAEILDRVTNVEVRFLDRSGEWHLEWPPLDRRGPQSLLSEPRAVEFAVELEDFGRVYRLVETSG